MPGIGFPRWFLLKRMVSGSCGLSGPVICSHMPLGPVSWSHLSRPLSQNHLVILVEALIHRLERTSFLLWALVQTLRVQAPKYDKYVHQTIITVPNANTIKTPYWCALEPWGEGGRYGEARSQVVSDLRPSRPNRS